MRALTDIQNVVAKRSFNSIQGSYYDLIRIWKSWYRGNVNNFHYYHLTNFKGKQIRCERKTLSMAKSVCEDWSSALSKFEITFQNPKNGEIVQADLERNNASMQIKELIETSFALGTGATVEFLKDGMVEIDFIKGDVFIPIRWNNGVITGLVTVNQYEQGVDTNVKFISHLSFHFIQEGKYIVEHLLYKSSDEAQLGKRINIKNLDENLEEIEVFDTDKPFFQIFKPAIANNVDLQNPMGISIYANSIDVLKAVDNKYDLMDNEFTDGRKRLVVGSNATQKDIDDEGQIISYFDPTERFYEVINSDGVDIPVMVIDTALRAGAYVTGINSDLGFLGQKCGFGSSKYEFTGNVVEKKEIEVKTENSEFYDNVLKHRSIIKTAIIGMCESILFLHDIFESEIDVVFNNDLFENEAENIASGLTLLKSGLISKEHFRETFLFMDQKENTDMQKQIDKENATVTAGAIDFTGIE